MEKLEDRHIPGITAKGLAWLIGSVITIVIAVMGATISINKNIGKVDSSVQAVSYKVETMQKQGEARDTEIKLINDQIKELQLQTAINKKKK